MVLVNSSDWRVQRREAAGRPQVARIANASGALLPTPSATFACETACPWHAMVTRTLVAPAPRPGTR